MTIKYRYTQAGKAHEGEIQRMADMTGVHEVVRAVVQQIANETGETLVFSMLNPAATAAVGTDLAEPQGIGNTGQRSVEAVDISEDNGESWNSLDVHSEPRETPGTNDQVQTDPPTARIDGPVAVKSPVLC